MNISNPHTQKYYLSHKDEIAFAQEKYRVANMEKFREANARWREKNRDTVVDCPCGSQVKTTAYSHHKLTKKHLAFLANNPSVTELVLAPPRTDLTKVLCVNCGRSKMDCRNHRLAKKPPSADAVLAPLA